MTTVAIVNKTVGIKVPARTACWPVCDVVPTEAFANPEHESKKCYSWDLRAPPSQLWDGGLAQLLPPATDYTNFVMAYLCML